MSLPKSGHLFLVSKAIGSPLASRNSVQIHHRLRHFHSPARLQVVSPSPQATARNSQPRSPPIAPPTHISSAESISGKKAYWDGKALYAFRDRQFQPLPSLWLRDHCQCALCFHLETKQRLYNTFENTTPPEIKSCQEMNNGFQIVWHDGHESFYDHAWLREQDEERLTQIRQGRLPNVNLWGSNIQDSPPQVDYDEVMQTEEGVKKWCSEIRLHGFSFVDGCPPTPEATKALLERISFIRQTHYGGYWEVLSEMASIDTAYTNLALEAHTDTTYFSDPVGLQMFHLLSHEGGKGGESLLVDGAAAAAKLFQKDPEAYKLLSEIAVRHHASGDDGINFTSYRGFSVLEHDLEQGHLLRIRWNNADRASIECPMHMKSRWYEAARMFNQIISDERSQYWSKLLPGRPLIFDNWRVLHGRAAFTGRRRLGGGYINRDDFVSRLKMLEYGKDKVLAATVTG
ncbi:Trimethyllysine dioxygenase [Viridothelium virens]|uniref:trimethyllysine dioxygenase n=1 Tax=Viridothelium virens TaxID=1048519 RepID=A0A6A6HFY7_VIRVR|nr:Trimethyllysine dioxygenase [Viridothelium virens]